MWKSVAVVSALFADVHRCGILFSVFLIWWSRSPKSSSNVSPSSRGAFQIALLSQEGSTIETAVEIVRGVVPEPHSLEMHFEIFRLGTTPRVIA